MKPTFVEEHLMKRRNNIYATMLMVMTAIFPSIAFSAPEAANFSTSISTLAVPFVKVDGVLLFKNVEFSLNFSTGGFEITAIEEISPNDIINISTTIPLAEGSFIDGPFHGFLNVPILITTERQTGNLIYRISILDSSGFVRSQSPNISSGIRQTAFTPTFDDTFRIRVEGITGSGSLIVQGSVLISAPISSRNQVQVISKGSSLNGTLAEAAFDDYLFDGTFNVPIIIRTQRTSGSLIYHISVIDATGALLGTTANFSSGIRETPFTPPSNGTFRIRVEGVTSFGDYILNLP